MKRIVNLLLICVGLVVAAGCSSIYTATVTIAEVGDSILNEYAKLYNRGLITPDQHAKAEAAHLKYREAMGALGDALEASKATGDKGSVATALRAAKNAINPLVALISTYVGTEKAQEIRLKLNNAVAQ